MIQRALTDLKPISLAALDRDAALRERFDVKYILDTEDLRTMLARLDSSHRVLQVDGGRTSRYRTTYYDTPDLLTYREHRSGRRRRFKVRLRRYLDSGCAMLELKLKGKRGSTVKHTFTCGSAELDEQALGSIRATLRDQYGRELPSPLVPTLTVEAKRIMLVASEPGERVSCDLDVVFGGFRLAAGYAIVESKSDSGSGLADETLRELGARPVDRCSKYCLGVALTHPGQRVNDLLPLIRRFFEPAELTTSAARAT